MRNALRFRKLAHVLVLSLACWLTLRIFAAVDGSEFIGGSITGPIGTMCEVAIIGFLVGIVFAFPFPRVASGIGLLASLLSLPLLLYFIAPGPFRAVFRGEYSVPLQSNFLWSAWLLEPAIAVLIVVAFSVWNLFSEREKVKRPAT
jgi:hypothetical protein